MTLPVDITTSERRGLGEKNGDFFLSSEFSFLIEFYTYGSMDFVVLRITIIENSWIQVSAVIVPFLSG